MLIAKKSKDVNVDQNSKPMLMLSISAVEGFLSFLNNEFIAPPEVAAAKHLQFSCTSPTSLIRKPDKNCTSEAFSKCEVDVVSSSFRIGQQ